MRLDLPLPHLRVLRRLAGRVWVAEHERLGCEVAVKFATDAASTARLSREALTSATVSSPYLVRVIGSGHTPTGESYLVSELAPGEPLEALLTRGRRLSLDHLLEVARQLAWAIERLHQGSILHAAIDPSHVMVQQTPSRLRVRLLGLASSSLVGRDELRASKSAGAPSLTADLVALARLLWAAADPPTQATLGAWFARATADRSESRFQSALELADAMTELLEPASGERAFDADEELAALRALLQSGDVASVARRLEGSLSSLLDADRVADVAVLLADQTAPVLDGLRLRALAEQGDLTLLAAATPPEARTADARLGWALVLSARGKPREALDALPDLATLPAPKLRFEGTLLAARCSASLGARDHAVELLTEVVASTPGEEATREALLASILAHTSTSNVARANRLASSAKRRLEDASPHDRRRVVPLLSQALYRLGRPRDALVLLESSEGRARATGDADARQAFVRAVCLCETGELDLAKTATADVKRAVGPDSALGPFCDNLTAVIYLAEGRIAALNALLPELRVRAEGLPELSESVASVSVRARQMRREPPAPRATSDLTMFGRLGRLHEQSAAARWNLLSAGEIAALDVDPGLPPEMRAQRALVSSHAAVVSGDLDGALRAALEAVAESRAHGHALHESDARVAVCEALAVAGDRDALAVAAAGLSALARRTGSPRVIAAGDLFAAVAGNGPDRFATLERIASTETAAEFGLVARALLGGDAPIDRVDQAVVAGVRRWVALPSAQRADAVPSAGPSWGLDEGAIEAWLPTGERVSFRDTPLLWRLLLTLAERGSSSKEVLTQSVWDEREYHPLRHDNRLQAAIRKLRVRLHDDARALVVTRGDGYALGGTPRRARPM